jgi:spore germination protein KA
MGVMNTIKKIFEKSSPNQGQSTQSQNKEPLSSNLKQNLDEIKKRVGNSADVAIREMVVGKAGDLKIAVIFTDGLADTKSVNDFVVKSLLSDLGANELSDSKSNAIQKIKDYVLAVGEIKEVSNYPKLLNSILSGDTAVVLDGYDRAITVGLKGWEDRGVQEPSSQTVIRGPKEGFSENIRTNTALIRRKIKDPNLWLENRVIGKVTQTNVAIMYINGIVSDQIVQEVRKRLDRIDIDGILDSGYIEELIQDETFTPFPTVFNTERPDTVAAALLEGRIAILVDGTPYVLTVPVTLTQFYQSPEDYYQRADIGTLLRILRYICFFIALMGPSLYVAITTFHQEMIPTQLLYSIAAQREGVPFPAFIEALIMEITFEILREAGVRMPRAVGQSVSIVGALVIGQAAVQAGIVSAAMVIVVSITAIASFVCPNFNMAIAIRMLRFPLMALAASFGLFGITVGLIALVLHLSSLRSFGIPYMIPFGPFIAENQKDAILRVPWWGMFARPRLINQKNLDRENNPPTLKPEQNK